MQAVVAARWAAHGPRAGYHVGDLAWWTTMWEWPTARGPSARQRLWLDQESGAPPPLAPGERSLTGPKIWRGRPTARWRGSRYPSIRDMLG
jgi:hypothetical protein